MRDTEARLRHAGRKGFEAFVFWSGRLEESDFKVRAMHVPRQTGYRSKDGLLVRVEGEALHALNVWLYENDEILGAQVHAHPTDAYHSATDDSFPVVTMLGGLSLVVPNFCRRGLLRGSAAFRLTKAGWEQSHLPVAQLVEVV